MSRPVICQLVHGLPIGGTEVLVDRLIRRLSDRYRFVVACLDDVGELGQRLIDDGYELHQLGRRPGFDWGCVRRLARCVRDSGAQLVHAHQYTPYAYITAARLLGGRPPVLFTEHGRFYPDVSSAKRRLFNRLLTSRHDRLVAVGGAVKQALVENEGLSAERIEVVHNGVASQRASLSAERRAQIRREFGVADGDFIILQVARLDPIKDHSTALKALAQTVGQEPRIRLVLVGDGPERPAIERQIADLRLRPSVTMLGQRSDVSELLAAADAFLLTSVSEGLPVTIIEAMATGLPVISTRVGGVPEVINDGDSGLLAPAGDATALAAAIVRLTRDAHLRTRLAENGRERVASRFSEEQMMQRYDDLYAELTQRHRHSSRVRQVSTPTALTVAPPK
jgi:sugar transferase (PEP-CTERM/EpsH1 system associated)